MSASLPEPPKGYASWLDYATEGPLSFSIHARAELAELRDLLTVYKETADVENAQWEKSYSELRKELAALHHRCISTDAQLAETHRQLDQATSDLADTKAQLALQAANTVEAMQQRDEAKQEVVELRAQVERMVQECDEAKAQVAELKKGILALGGLPGIPRDGGIGGRRRFEMSMQYEKYWDWNRFVGLVRGEQKGPDCDACEGKGYFYVNKRPYFCEVCSGWSWLGPENDSGREERRAEQAAFVAKLRAEALPGAAEPAAGEGEVQP